jgi:hypothetical protein
MIPTDEDIEGGFLGPADMAPADIDVQRGGESRRGSKRVRLIDGTLAYKDEVDPALIQKRSYRKRSGGKNKNEEEELAEEEARIAVRKQRVARYQRQIIEDINPFVLDVGLMFTGFPKDRCIEIKGDKAYVTQLGQAHMFNDVQIKVFATTVARMQETDRGQQLFDAMQGISVYAFLALSGMMLVMWFMQLSTMRKMQIQAVKAAMQGMAPPDQTVPQNGKGAQGIGDILNSFMDSMKPKTGPDKSDLLAS